MMRMSATLLNEYGMVWYGYVTRRLA